MMRLLTLTVFIHFLIHGVIGELISVITTETIFYEINEEWTSLKDNVKDAFK